MIYPNLENIFRQSVLNDSQGFTIKMDFLVIHGKQTDVHNTPIFSRQFNFLYTSKPFHCHVVLLQ